MATTATTMRQQLRLGLGVLLALGLALGLGGVPMAQSTQVDPGLVDQHYRQAGPWSTQFSATAGCCDRSGFGYAAWWPDPLAGTPARRPVIVWGNGTGAPPEAYAYLLRHWASWGYVVVASRQPSAGSGAEMLDALAFARSEDARPDSPVYQRLDFSQVAAAGHSQGAMGALNALRDSAGSVRTALSVAIPAQKFCPYMGHCADSSTLSTGSVLYLNGQQDTFLSPSRQADGLAGLQSDLAYYQATPRGVGRAWGTRAASGHSDVMGQPNCSGQDPNCVTGVTPLLGYTTAWLQSELLGDAAARAAFTPDAGEFFSAAGWQNQRARRAP
jgi:hypothetical protein